MNIRRGLTFAWRMGLAYIQVSLIIALCSAAFLGLTLLVLTLIDTGISSQLADTLRLIVQIVSYTSVGISALLGLGMVWNVIGVGLGMALTGDEVDLKFLRVTIPKRLTLYNLLGLPLLLVGLMFLAQIPAYVAVCVGMLTIMVSFATGDIASNAWEKVVDWYELRGQGSKRKQMPSIQRLQDADGLGDELLLDDEIARELTKRQ